MINDPHVSGACARSPRRRWQAPQTNVFPSLDVREHCDLTMFCDYEGIELKLRTTSFRYEMEGVYKVLDAMSDLRYLCLCMPTSASNLLLYFGNAELSALLNSLIDECKKIARTRFMRVSLLFTVHASLEEYNLLGGPDFLKSLDESLDGSNVDVLLENIACSHAREDICSQIFGNRQWKNLHFCLSLQQASESTALLGAPYNLSRSMAASLSNVRVSKNGKPHRDAGEIVDKLYWLRIQGADISRIRFVADVCDDNADKPYLEKELHLLKTGRLLYEEARIHGTVY